MLRLRRSTLFGPAEAELLLQGLEVINCCAEFPIWVTLNEEERTQHGNGFSPLQVGQILRGVVTPVCTPRKMLTEL